MTRTRTDADLVGAQHPELWTPEEIEEIEAYDLDEIALDALAYDPYAETQVDD